MFGIVRKDGNNNKYIHPLTSDVGAGAPVGTIIAQYKKANPEGYLYLDGSTFDADQYPALYMYLGTNVLPDYREFALVGAEQNSTDTIATHDVYTEGEGKDDAMQFHKHNIGANGDTNYPLGYGSDWSTSYANGISKTATTKGIAVRTSGMYQGRNGDVTRGKRKAVFFYIKATSGLVENQQENVLNTAKDYIDEVEEVTVTVHTAFGTIKVIKNRKIVQVFMNGSSGSGVAPGTLIASGLPVPKAIGVFPVIKFTDQTVVGLLQLTIEGKLYAYTSNVRNLETGVYNFTYIAE